MAEVKKTNGSRILGDAWQDWREGGADGLIRSRKRLFIVCSFLSLVLFSLALFFLTYLIVPRLASWGIGWLGWTIFGVSLIFLWVVFSLVVISLWLGKNLCCLHLPQRGLFLLFLLSKRTASFLGVSRDSFANSFLKVYNLFTRLLEPLPSIAPEKVLVLLPRCLTGELRERLTMLAREKGCPVYTVGGGEAARKVISQEKPEGVVAIACERDLISGIAEILGKIPVLGISNQRPCGPCQGTVIELSEFQDALLYFLRR